MSKQIDVMPCDFCKAGCQNADLSIDTQKLHAVLGDVYVVHTLVCSHEEACRMQRECKITQDDVN